VKTGEVASSILASFARSNSSDKYTREPIVPTGKMPGWRGEEFTSSVKRRGAVAPLLCSTIPPGLLLAGANRGPVGGSRRGEGKPLPAMMAAPQEIAARESCVQATKLDVV
jgi:hypothetical protein